MTTIEIANTIKNFIQRMHDKRPDLYEKMISSESFDVFMSTSSEFMDWEEKEWRKKNGGQETLPIEKH